MAVVAERWAARSRAARQAVDTTVALQGATLYLLAFAILSILIFASPAFFSTDDYYHARISEVMLRQGRLALDFPWLPLTLLSPDRFVDHHLLYHIALAVPVALFGMTGAKLVTVAIAAGIVLAAWAFLRAIGVRYPAIWALGLFAMSPTFLFRVLMIRTQGFSVLLLFLALYALARGRYRWLVPLGFLYVWLYNGFILMLGVAGLYAVAVFVVERRVEWRPVAWCALGLALGLVINPYFPRNIAFVLDHVGVKVNLAQVSTQLGAEWEPLDTRTFVSLTKGALLALIAGVLRTSLGSRRDAVEWTLLFLSLAMMMLAFNAMRFLEYFPAFPILYAAAAWGRDDWMLDLRGISSRALNRWRPALARIGPLVAPAALIFILTYFSVDTLHYTYRMARLQRDPAEFAGPALWLARNTPPGTLVTATGFNDFARLIFYNQHNTYVSGLDPTYLEMADADAWATYSKLTRPGDRNVARNLAALGSSYLIIPRRAAFHRWVDADPAMQMVFRDQYHELWKVEDSFFAANRE